MKRRMVARVLFAVNSVDFFWSAAASRRFVSFLRRARFDRGKQKRVQPPHSKGALQTAWKAGKRGALVVFSLENTGKS